MAPASGAGASSARTEPEDDAERLRGIVVLPYERVILFTDEVERDVAKLPRGQLQIVVDGHRLMDDPEE
jgi:hypothetical protein